MESELAQMGQSGDRPVYTIEVCAVCGGQLSNRFASPGLGGSDPGTGRCGNDRSHWQHGGVLLDVTPIAEQPEDRFYPRGHTRSRLTALGVIPALERGQPGSTSS